MIDTIHTIGVYGSSEDEFFEALKSHCIDTFCDIRRHRGVRGATYKFVNSGYLQKRLSDLQIKYFHLKGLAPTNRVREFQSRADERHHVRKRDRTHLSVEFVESYRSDVLSKFDINEFRCILGDASQRIVLFCVERSELACHRHLAADRLRNVLSVKGRDITYEGCDCGGHQL